MAFSPGVNVESLITATPAAARACAIGVMRDRAVATTVIVTRSPAISIGGVQWYAAASEFHGVKRSIWARTIPSRKSAARLGKSSGRKRKRDERSTTWVELPRSASLHSTDKALSAPLR